MSVGVGGEEGGRHRNKSVLVGLIFIEKYFFLKNLAVSIFFGIFACSNRVLTKHNFNT